MGHQPLGGIIADINHLVLAALSIGNQDPAFQQQPAYL
jgi:hypothetical protein